MMSAKAPSAGALRALLWEDWRRTRAVFLSILALGVGLSLSVLIYDRVYLHGRGGYLGSLDSEVYVLAYLPSLCYGLLLLLSLTDPSKVTLKIPARQYTLPVSPRKLAVAHLLFRVASVGVLAVALTGLIQVAFLEFDPLILLAGALGVMATFLATQALAWTVGNLGVGAFFASVGALCFMFSATRAGEAIHLLFSALESAGVPAAVTLTVILVAIGWLAIEGSRLGRRQDLSWRCFAGLPAWQRAFRIARVRGPLTAQIAYEWGRKGLLLPTISVFLVATGALALIIAMGGLQNRWVVLGTCLATFPVYATPIAATLAGVLGLLDDYKHRTTGIGTFLFSRAADSSLISRARLATSLLTVAAGIAAGLVIMGLGALMLTAVRPAALTELVRSIAGDHASRFMLMFLAYLLLVWTLYWMTVPAVLLWLWFMLVAGGYAILDGGHHPFMEQVMIWPPSIAMMVISAIVVWRSARDKLISTVSMAMAVMTIAVTWAVITWIGVSASILETGSAQAGYLTVAVALIALSLCPAFPILAQPMLVDRLRHG